MEMKLTDEEVKIIAADKNWRNGATYDLAADLLSTRAKLAALQESSKRQVDQFNDGYDAAFAGEPDNIEPDYEVDEDQWRIGYAWAMYDKLKRDIAALQDKVAFQPMSTFKPKSDKLQEYLVLFGDADIDVATYENSDNPEERTWYHDIFGPNESEIYPYGWMDLPEPKVSALPIPAEGE